MLLNDTISIIKRIEKECEKEINVIRFGELNPSEIHEIVFVPEFYYCDDYTDEDVNDNHNKPGGTTN
jgi:hypothetical protein